MLNAFALPAARVPPIKVARVKVSVGKPCSAKTIAGRVETNKSSTTRNFIKSMKPRTLSEVFTPELFGTGKDYSALMCSVLTLF
jgi:hypothetical protein